MKLHVKNGELKVDEFVLLPAIENSEFIVEEGFITSREVIIAPAGIERFLEPGNYIEITAPIMVKRYYKIEYGEA